ncbi:MAG: FtsX-like permease family protein, partial [Candidatus Thorarchaeota archaeon]
IASSTGLFTFDLVIYMQFFGKTQFTILSIIIAIAIAMYLPAAYLVHVARRIDVTEIGQPMTEEPEASAEDVSVWRYATGLGVALVVLIGAPLLVDPTSTTALLEILIATIMLFAAAYLGSRFMQIVTARMSSGTTFLMGEKSLYLSKSLRRRRRQFIPLLVILTLTLTTTMMMVIQSSSFEATMEHEIDYAIGADMRIECDSRLLRFNETLLSYSGIQNVTPVVQTTAYIGTNRLFLSGVDAEKYLEVGFFTSESFVTGTPSEVMSELDATENGIIISHYHSLLWNKTVGDEIRVRFNGRAIDFVVVGTMRSAPGLGLASSTYLTDPTIATIFNFQLTGEGFLIANVDFMADRGSSRADLFLAKALPYSNLTESINSINSLSDVRILLPESFNAEARSYTLGLYLSGFQGLTMIGFVMCTFMGLASLALFLGSAVLERKSEYALFRAMGGSKRQVISMVFGEFAGSVVTAITISAILGVLFGYSLSIMSFGISPFSPALAEVLAYPLVALLAILSLESVVMLASCYFPAKRASSIDPAGALRNL